MINQESILEKTAAVVRLSFSTTTDSSTATARSRQRYERVVKTALCAATAKALSLTVGLLSVPLTLSYLGQERFGLWMTLTNFIGFLCFADLGLGIGLRNQLSICYGKDDKRSPQALVSSALCLLCGITVALVAVCFLLLPHLPLERLIVVKTLDARADLLPTLMTLVVMFAVGLPCNLVVNVLHGYQQGYSVALIYAIGQILGFGGVVLCICWRLPLPCLVASVMGMPLVVMIIYGLRYLRLNPWLTPSLRMANGSAVRALLSTGVVVVVAQLGAVLMINGPTVVIANRLGASQVAPFAVTQQLVNSFAVLLDMALSPLWPAYGEAAARGDFSWVLRTFRRSLVYSAIVEIPLFLAIMFFGRSMIHLWTQKSQVVPPWSLLAACNTWALLMVWTRASAYLLNGLNRMKGQAFYGLIVPAMAVTLGWVIAPSYGVSGVLWTVVLAGEVVRGVCLALDVRLALRAINAPRI